MSKVTNMYFWGGGGPQFKFHRCAHRSLYIFQSASLSLGTQTEVKKITANVSNIKLAKEFAWNGSSALEGLSVMFSIKSGPYCTTDGTSNPWKISPSCASQTISSLYCTGNSMKPYLEGLERSRLLFL